MLKVRTRNLGNVTVLYLEGRMVNGEMAALREQIHSHATSSVILDLARVTTIDASGLGLMLDLRSQARSRGVRLKLMNVTKFVSQVFEVTRLDSVFEVIPRGESTIARGQPARLGLAACA